MKIIKLTGLVFILLLSALFSCKKTDVNTGLNNKESYSKKFFEKPSTSSAEVEAIIDLLKKENDHSGFVDKLPDNAGLPVWEKTIIGKSTTNYAARGVFIDQNGNYLISLSIDDKSLSGLLFAMKKDGKYEFFYYDNNYAYQIAFSNNYSIQQRENVLGLFISMSNYVFGITKFKSIPKELFADLNDEIIEEGGNTKKMFLKPPSGMPPIILSSLGVIGTQEICVYKFSGTCNCEEPTVNHAGHCRDWMTGCATCSISNCELLIFEEVPGDDPPPTNPNGGTGTSGTTGTTSSSGGVAGPGGLLPNTTTGGLPNAPCSNKCAWYSEAAEYEFDSSPPDEPSFCSMSCEEAQQTLNAVTATEIDDVLQINYGTESIDAVGIIRKPVAPVHGLVTLNFHWGSEPPSYSAFFKGVVYKHNTNDLWKWESCAYNYTAMDRGSLPPCFGITHNVNVSPIVISNDKLDASAFINFQFYGRFTCLGGLTDPQLIYSGGNRVYHLPSNQ